MMVVKQARQNDAYHFSDWVMLWIAEQIAERQEQGRLRLQQNKLLTAYAQTILTKSEYKAQCETMQAHPCGNDRHVVVHSKAGGVQARSTVDLRKKTCTCMRFILYRLPCLHVVYLLDKHKKRDTCEKMLTFRSEWIPSYFWAENYVSAYADANLHVPPMDLSTTVSLRKGARTVLPPPAQRVPGQPKSTGKRKSAVMPVGRRSRARWDAARYVRDTGIANECVIISDPTIFHRDPRGKVFGYVYTELCVCLHRMCLLRVMTVFTPCFDRVVYVSCMCLLRVMTVF